MSDEKASLEKLSSGQFGLVSEAQLERGGFTRSAIRWAVDDRRLVKVFGTVYRLVGSEESWNQQALTAVLIHGKGAALTHATAAMLWRISGFANSKAIHVTPAARMNIKLPKGVVRHRLTRAFQIVERGELPTTTLARTLVDIAPDLDEEALEIAIDSAQYRRPFLEQELEEDIGTSRRRFIPGGQRIIDLLDLRAGITTESPLETKVRRALRKQKVSAPELQFDIFDNGRFVIRADFAWPRHRVVLHCDGYTWHGKRKQFDLDAEQRSKLSALDWQSLYVTDRTFKSGEWLHSLARTLKLREPQLKLL
ncbi:MAG: hypothetical protein JNM17_13360 [Archangium sp.]|nr:hypothetical protein [Archangium sp.]